MAQKSGFNEENLLEKKWKLNVWFCIEKPDRMMKESRSHKNVLAVLSKITSLIFFNVIQFGGTLALFARNR